MEPKTTESKQQFNFQISTELKELLDKASVRNNMSMTQYVTALLAKDLKGSSDQEELSVLLSKVTDLISKQNYSMPTWDYDGLKSAQNFFGTQHDWNQTLITCINKVSCDSYRSSSKKFVDKIVVHSAAAFSIVQEIEYFDVNKQWEGARGVKVGTLSSRYDVFFEPDPSREFIVDLYSGVEFIGELELLNIPKSTEGIASYRWDYNGMKDAPNFFGTQLNWNERLLEMMYLRANADFKMLTHHDVEVFSTKVFDLFMHSGMLENTVIDRVTQRSKADVKGKMMTISFNEMVPELFNTIRITARDHQKQKNWFAPTGTRGATFTDIILLDVDVLPKKHVDIEILNF